MNFISGVRPEELQVDKADDVPVVIDAGPEIEEFANALDDCLNTRLPPAEKKSRVLDLPRKYYMNTIRRLDNLRPINRRYGTEDVDMDTDEAEPVDLLPSQLEEIDRLEKEAQTWDLLRRVLPLRYPNQLADSSYPKLKPERDLLHDFLQTDPLAQERCAVLQWLQSNASSGPDIDELARELQQNADRGDIIAHGWLHTRSAIKLRKSVTAWPHLLDRQSPNIARSHNNADGAPLVTQLDPDAALRQDRKLEPKDEFFERAIWLGCFEHLRRGSSLETIRDWCQERTEMWRAISMSAMLLSVDDKESPVETNPMSFALWRRMCFSLARQGGSDDYERAVYGMLSGDIHSVEKIATSWDDFLFANYNALLRTQLDSYVLGQCSPHDASALTQSFPAFDATQYLGEQEGVEKRLVKSLESRKGTQAQAMEPNKALQASIIAKEMGHHLYEQGMVMVSDANATKPSALLPHLGLDAPEVNKDKFFRLNQHDGLRIVAHVYLLIATLENMSGKSPVISKDFSPKDWLFGQESIVAAYTEYLHLAGLQELIPLYCSLLEAPRSYEALSANLILEDSPDRRKMLLRLVQKADIDILEFVENQATILYQRLILSADGSVGDRRTFRIIEDGPPRPVVGRPIIADFFDSHGLEDGAVDEEHEHLVRALEWLLLTDQTWPIVFSIGTKAYKFFLKHMHLNSARRLMDRVAFADVMRDTTGQDGLDDTYYDDVEFWTQQLEQSEIQDVKPHEVMADARNFRELEALVRALDSLETMGALVAIHEDVEQSHTREYKEKITVEIGTTKENMQPLLRNWLLTGIAGGDTELLALRKAYLPETILAYVSALQYSGLSVSRDYLLECMELSAVIAQRESDLIPTIQAGARMKELVEVFTACSKSLAIATGEKRGPGLGSKKLREMGWSRDVWSVKS